MSHHTRLIMAAIALFTTVLPPLFPYSIAASAVEHPKDDEGNFGKFFVLDVQHLAESSDTADTAEGELAEPCAEGDDNRQSDLCAQWKAADAARLSAVWTGVAAVSGIGTLFAAIAAALYARAAAVHTKTGAEASNAAVEIARDQTRAFLVAEDCVLEVFPRESESVLFVHLTNHGQSPATNVEVFVKLRFRPEIFGPRSLRYDDADNEKILGSQLLKAVAPGKRETLYFHMSWYPLFSGDEDIVPILQRYLTREHTFVSVKCRLVWKDLYGNENEEVISFEGRIGANVDFATYTETSGRFIIIRHVERKNAYHLNVPRDPVRPEGFEF